MKALDHSLTAIRKAAGPALIIFCVSISISASWYTKGKITICHVPPGNPANRHTIEVSQNALQAHLDHGDYIGSCSGNGEGAVEHEKEEGMGGPL
jgi:hypothetical protein